MSNRLTVVLLTYKRTEYAIRTVRALGEHLTDVAASSSDVRIHIADDGSPQEHKDAVLGEALNYWPQELISISDSGHKGYGANYNAATQIVHGFSDYILPVEDDWELIKDFDPKQIIESMSMFPDQLGCVRLGNIGYTDRLQAYFLWDQWRHVHYLCLDPTSPEKHVFAGHPRIESVEWSRRLGPWPEGLLPGETELSVCSRSNSRIGVAWPIDYVKPSGDLFGHIGSIRSTDV